MLNHLVFEPDVHLAPLHPRLSNQPIVPSHGQVSTDVGRISLITLRGVKGSVALQAAWRLDGVLWRARDQCRLIAAISRLEDTLPSDSTSLYPCSYYGVMDHGCEIIVGLMHTASISHRTVRDKLGDLMSADTRR